MESKPKTLSEYALIEVPIPGTRLVVPFLIGAMIMGGLVWLYAYNVQKQKGEI